MVWLASPAVVHGLHHVQAQAGAGGVVRGAEEDDVRLQLADLLGRRFRAEAIVVGALAPTMYSVSVPLASSGYMEYVGGNPRAVRPGPPKAWRICWRTSLEPLAAQMFVRVQPVAKVFGQGFAEFGEFTVRVAVQPGSGLRHGLGDRRPDIRRDPMGVLVDVEQDGDVQLRRAVRASGRADWSGGAVGSGAQAGQSPEQFRVGSGTALKL